MVSLKFLLVGAIALIAPVLADQAADVQAAKDYFAVYGTGNEIESVPESAKFKRSMKDPYRCWTCHGQYKPLGRCETNCNRNNCFRAFLNARDGSDGRHCPSEAFGFCCLWYSAPYFIKVIAIEYGILQEVIPWTANCLYEGTTAEKIGKLDDVCGCTINHDVTIDETYEYYKLRYYPIFSPICRAAP